MNLKELKSSEFYLILHVTALEKYKLVNEITLSTIKFCK